MLKPFKIRKPDFSIKRPSLRIKLHRPNLELNQSGCRTAYSCQQIISPRTGAQINPSEFPLDSGAYLFCPSRRFHHVVTILFLGDALLEYGNFKKWRWARRTFGLLFFKTLRNKERIRTKFQVSGSMYVLAAAIICTLLFSKPIAAIALTVMLISDTCAALFGKAFGTRKLYKSKSLEGTVAFFLSALLINMLYEPVFHFTYAGASSPALPPPWQKCSKTSSKLTTICLFRFS